MKICPPHSTTVELQFIYFLIFYKNKQINDELEREREREREKCRIIICQEAWASSSAGTRTLKPMVTVCGESAAEIDRWRRINTESHRSCDRWSTLVSLPLQKETNVTRTYEKLAILYFNDLPSQWLWNHCILKFEAFYS